MIFFVLLIYLIVFFLQYFIFSLNIYFDLIILSTLCTISGLMVVVAKHPLNSLWGFIITILNISLLIFLLELEFFGLIWIILYLGAIAIFFLFMIMLLNVQTTTAFTTIASLYKMEFLTVLLLLLHFFLFFKKLLLDIILKNEVNFFLDDKFTSITYFFSIYDVMGHFLYTHYMFVFLSIGFFPFILMVGVIILTQQDENLIKKKKIDFIVLKQIQQSIFLKIKKISNTLNNKNNILLFKIFFSPKKLFTDICYRHFFNVIIFISIVLIVVIGALFVMIAFFEFLTRLDFNENFQEFLTMLLLIVTIDDFFLDRFFICDLDLSWGSSTSRLKDIDTSSTNNDFEKLSKIQDVDGSASSQPIKTEEQLQQEEEERKKKVKENKELLSTLVAGTCVIIVVILSWTSWYSPPPPPDWW